MWKRNVLVFKRVTHVSASIFKQILSDHHLRGWCGGRSRLAARSWAGAGAGGGGHHAAARCRCQCAGAATSAAHRGQPQRSLWGWADLWEGGREALKQPSPGQCGFRLFVVQQYRLWQALQGGPGCGFSLNHDCQVSLVFTALLPVAGRGWKASNHLWSGTRLFWDTRPCWLLIPLPRRQCGEGGHCSELLGCRPNSIHIVENHLNNQLWDALASMKPFTTHWSLGSQNIMRLGADIAVW